eukprot:7384522-Alexandrium_andersonii.AAC.1
MLTCRQALLVSSHSCAGGGCQRGRREVVQSLLLLLVRPPRARAPVGSGPGRTCRAVPVALAANIPPARPPDSGLAPAAQLCSR